MRRWAVSSFYHKLVRAYTIPTWLNDLSHDISVTDPQSTFDLKLYDDIAWIRQSFQYDPILWDPQRLPRSTVDTLSTFGRSYIRIGELFAFPERDDNPVINDPSTPITIWWDESVSTPKLLLQLGPHMPPFLWLPIQPKLSALKRIASECVSIDAAHLKTNLAYYESVQHSLETQHGRFGETLSEFKMKDRLIADMRHRDPRALWTSRDPMWPCDHSLFLGTTEHFSDEAFRERNPFIFSWPLLVSQGNVYLEDTPARMCAFQTLYSKSKVILSTRLDLQMDPTSSGDPVSEEALGLLEVPIIATVQYPKQSTLSGGPGLVRRFNQAFETTFPLDTPVDVLGCFVKEPFMKGIPELVQEVRFLHAAVNKVFDKDPQTRLVSRLAQSILHAALVVAPSHDTEKQWQTNVFQELADHPLGMIRLACAKGGEILGRPDLVQRIMDKESNDDIRQMLDLCLEMAKATQQTTR